MDWLTAFLTLLLVMDPLGNIPVFLSVLRDVDEKRRKRVLIRELLIALGILLFFLFFGKVVLDALGLQTETISIGGAIVLFIIAIRMIFPPAEGGIMGEHASGEPFIVPLAIPLVAGPSAMAFLMLLVGQNPEMMLEWTGALVAAWAVSAVILFFSTKFYQLLGDRGLVAVERLMGMILVMISVQMALDGLTHVLD